jgi:crotonobetainyl-CoA:carnitine CoA-transferase CaiB-like acyl-CoA transferase
MVARVWPRSFYPLEDVRIVDVTSSLAGPYCTEILRALGAGVFKPSGIVRVESAP